MLGSLWLIPVLCLAGAVVNLMLGAFKAPKSAVTVVGVGSVESPLWPPMSHSWST